MQWYKMQSNNRSILKKSTAEKEVMDFTPIKFDLGTPLQALEYLDKKKKGSDFLMNPVVQHQTGVEQIQKQDLNTHAEEIALTKLKEIQEKAYSEGYELGLDEGKRKAYNEKLSELNHKASEFEKLFFNLMHLKSDLIVQNEAHLIELIYHMSSRISLREIELDNSVLVDVMKQALSLAQDEENVVVHVSPDQIEFVEELKKLTGREFEFLKKVKLEPNAQIKAGGCIVETNYGEVDSRIEQRLEKLWENVKDALPKVKNNKTYE